MGEGKGEAGRLRARSWRAPMLGAVLALAAVIWASSRLPANAQSDADAVFQPAFHQALRWSEGSGRTTYRMKVPLGRAGERVRVTFKAGEGAMRLYAASIAPAGQNGALAGPAVALTFNGASGASVAAGQHVTSDPARFPVEFGEEVALSFEVDGALAASAIPLFPGSYARGGSHAFDTAALGGPESPRAMALETVEVEGPPGRVFVAIGDSITEGYVGDHPDNYRNTWGFVAQGLLRMPVVNAGVSGQGVYEEIAHADGEVLSMQGITDCIVLLGTNDLGALDVKEVTTRLETLFAKLRPACRIWAGTLLPKNTTTVGSLAQVNADRGGVNQWLRTQAKVAGVIDFEAATRSADNPDRFQDGLTVDGIHPTIEGQRKMGQEAARYLAQAPILSVTGGTPQGGSPAGGNAVLLSGTGFKAGVSVQFGGTPADRVEGVSDTALAAVAPAHAAGAVDVVVTTPDGQKAALPGGYVYGMEQPGLALQGLEPRWGPPAGGTVVTLVGSGFEQGATLTLDGVMATNVRVESETSITFVAPAHEEGAVDVVLTNPDGGVATLSRGFRYGQGPRVTEVGPGSGRPGDAVTLSGGDFLQGVAVTFGGVPAQVGRVGNDALQVTAPAHPPGPVDVTVKNPDGLATTLPGSFLYVQTGTSAAGLSESTAGKSCGCGAAPTDAGALLVGGMLLSAWASRRGRRRAG